MRLDKYLAIKHKDLSRSEIKKSILDGSVLVDGEIKKPSFCVLESNVVSFNPVSSPSLQVVHEQINLEIIFESKDYIIVNKPPGVVVHPSDTGHFSGTVVNALVKKISPGVGDKLRPGIVHRIDKDTSGLLVVAKTLVAYNFFVDLFKRHLIKKVYICLVQGHLEHSTGVIDSPIGRDSSNRKKMSVFNLTKGRQALTEYKVLSEYSFGSKPTCVSLLEVSIKTGRTHQIRVHMSAIGHPIVCDSSYGTKSFNKLFKDKFGLDRQFLHAHSLKFKNLSGKLATYKSPIPVDLANVLNKLKD